MTSYLIIHVRFLEGRYHGQGDEPPSPFRLFQALVAGAGLSGPLDDSTRQALTWLEGLDDAPIIASPRMACGQEVTMFVPNNDLDKFGGDVRNIAKTRGAKKVWKPRHFDAAVPLIYVWPFAEDGKVHAGRICALSEKLYQLGRGVDMAWAWGEILDDTDNVEATLDAKLAEHNVIVRRPSAGDGHRLACPTRGSLESLERRHQSQRFRTDTTTGQRVFIQPPKPICRQVSYDTPPIHYLFELRASTDVERRLAWPLERASSLVVAARDAACARLKAAMSSYNVAPYLVGRQPNGSNAAPTGSRVRIIPIASIGMHYADRAIRRLLVEVPAACPIRSDDVRWAFSGAEFDTPAKAAGEKVGLVPSDDRDMLRHYGVGTKAKVFRSVTPVALPEVGKRRRIEPSRKLTVAKPGPERIEEISRAGNAVIQALRHAGVSAPVESLRLQREPFEAAGSRVEPFAEGTRFEKERLWHVEIAFGVPVKGPLLFGDGRFLGLGLMAPVRDFTPETLTEGTCRVS
ncbi:MAG: type I-U CRISPR-associated protein Csb2 [Chloracidobacterium sp.]